MADRLLPEGSRGGKMAVEVSYGDVMANCQQWNSRTIAARMKTNQTVFDQQTGTIQRPTNSLYRTRRERCLPSNPLQVCAYPARRYRRSNQVTSEACEFKYLLSANPAINEAINAIVNPPQPIGPQATENAEPSMPTRSTTNGTRNGGAYENYDLDPMDYDFDDVENDPSDEDDWGSSRRKKKKTNQGQGSSSRPSRRAAAAAASNTSVATAISTSGSANGGGNGAPPAAPAANNQTAEPRNYACQLCPARYKSRPGLTYHRLHVHKDENMINEMPKILADSVLSPSLDVSKTCDLCQGTKELNKKTNVPEALVSCHDCGRSAHPTCLTFTPNMLITTQKYGWQCIECKSCTHCGTSEDDDALLFCDDCDRGFHLYCLKPPLKEAPEGKWSCHLCQKEFGPNASLPPQPQQTSA
ncbi:hypothetical protein M3Y99_00605000 [Aphelenchoides fujianensis]|nr:hypothetical protein M3Y99_00605000 [Aphelenchoides fujianensis]